MVAIEEALRIIERTLAPLSPVRVPVDACAGTVLAEAVRTAVAIPPFDNSAMDGYAFRAPDLRGASPESPVELPVVRFVPAGDAADFELEPGTAAKIMTGAPLPRGADGILPIEIVECVGERVRVTRPLRGSEHVRFAGSDLERGEIALEAGAVIDPTCLGLIASVGVADLLVRPRPRVTVLSTGDELVEPGTSLLPGAIYDSNRRAIASFFRELGFPVEEISRARDERVHLGDRLREGLGGADLLVTIGGISVGDRDHVRAGLEELGCTVHFHGVAVRPGKPVAFSTREGTAVLSLPGNPVSSFLTALLFALPAAEILAGRPPTPLALERATLEAALGARPGIRRFVPATARRFAGDLYVAPLPKIGSHQLSSIARADGWIVLPEGSAGGREGDAVSFLPKRVADRPAAPLPFFLSIVGSRDHGKTRYIESCVRLLVERGHRVGTIKHTGHGHEIDREGKDSWRHRKAGAERAALVSREGGAVFLGAGQGSLVPRLFQGFDVVLIEGGARLADKIVEVWRAGTGEGPRFLDHPKILGVVSADPLETELPRFAPDDPGALLAHLAEAGHLERRG